MEVSAPFFYIFSGLAIVFSLLMVFLRSPVSSAFCLVLVLFSVAGLFAIMQAHLLAALQLLVYAGAVMVLFVFVIMLLNATSASLDLKRSHSALVGSVILGGGALIYFFIRLFQGTSTQFFLKGPFSAEAVHQAGGNTRVISEYLFSKYILPFELTSVLLLGSVVAVVAIAMRKTKT